MLPQTRARSSSDKSYRQYWSASKQKLHTTCLDASGIIVRHGGRATRRYIGMDSPPSLASKPTSTIHLQTSRSSCNSDSRRTNRRDHSLDYENPAAEGRALLARVSSFCANNFPGSTNTDTCNRKPVNYDIYLHVWQSVEIVTYPQERAEAYSSYKR